MRSFWSRVPMLRLAFALMAGIGFEIASDNVFHVSAHLLPIMLVLLVFALISVLVIGNIKNVTLAYKLRTYQGIALTLSVSAFAFLLTWFNTQKNYPQHFSNFLSDNNEIVAQINESPMERDKIMMTTAEVCEINNEKGKFKTKGRIQLKFLKDSLTERLQYGDVILLRSKIDSVQGPGNPYEFDYKAYDGFQNIYQQIFVVPGDWKLIATAQGNFIFTSVYRLRNSLLHIIRRYVKDKTDFAVAAAIMLGYRDYISPDLMRAYSSAGTLRVLHVSGLHVGVVFLILNFLLPWMDERGRKWAIAKAAFIILFIWFYACLTGLSLPVLRAALMFSMIQAGRVMARNINIYNIITASAIVLMLLNPFVITEVGFQLMYIAVFGIVYLQPKIARLIIIQVPWDPQFKKQKNVLLKLIAMLRYDLKWLIKKICDWIWQLSAASIAAQIALFPLSLFYFYQFPNLFLLANLVVIPIGNLILFTGTALFALGHIPYLSDVAGWMFKSLLAVLDKFIFWLNGLTYAQTNAICISAMEMILMYALIFLLFWLVEEKKPRILIASLVMVLGLCSFHSYRSLKQDNKKEMIVYDIPRHKAIAFISERKVLYDFDDSLFHDTNALINHVYHHWWENGINREIPLRLIQLPVGKIVLFEGEKFLIVDSTYQPMNLNLKNRLKVDLLILSGSPKSSIAQLLGAVYFEEVVFDSFNRPKRIESWEAECNRLNIDYWDVNKQGAFIREIHLKAL